MKKNLCLCICCLLMVFLSNVSLATFNDLKGYDWAKEYIEELEERKIISGTSETTFSPGKKVKREEFVKIIVGLFEYSIENVECDFDDVNENDWFYPYVASATNVGIINGVGNNRFGAGQYITRQDICTILYRALKDNGYNLKTDENKNMSFEDNEEINEYAYEAMESMYKAGVINGIDEQHVSPKSFATRAQMVKMAYLSDKQKDIDAQAEKKIVLNKNSIEIKVGEKETLNATVKPSNSNSEDIEWNSSNTKVAKVTKGVVEGKGKGTATITAKIKKTNIVVQCEVTVISKEDTSGGGGSGGGGSGGSGAPEISIPVTDISLNKTNLTLTKGNRETLTATIKPDNATNKNVRWESKDSTIASVSGGMITGLNVGTTTITVTTLDGNKTASCTVKVENPPVITVPVTGITLNKTSLSLVVGKSELLSATVKPDNATNKNIIWGSNASSIATVTSGGKVTAVKAGTATITVTTEDGLKTAKCIVNVENVENESSISINVGTSSNLKELLNIPNNENIDWESSDEKIVKVYSNGVIAGIEQGNATITAKKNDGSKTSCSVTVTNLITGFGLDKKQMTLTTKSGSYHTGKITANILPTNATNKNVSWNSSKTSVATVDNNGNVTAVGTGTATITAKTKDGSEKSASCKVTVVDTDVSTGDIEVHYIDVTGDAIFIKALDFNTRKYVTFMIDGGIYDNANTVISYIKNNLNITKIDYYIGSHAHSDHIGAAWPIIKEFQIKNIIVGTTTKNFTTEKDDGIFSSLQGAPINSTGIRITIDGSTKSYYKWKPMNNTIWRILNTVKTKNPNDLNNAINYIFSEEVTIKSLDLSKKAVNFYNGSGADSGIIFRGLGPINPVPSYYVESSDDYHLVNDGNGWEENNCNSLILRLKYGDKTFLFTGDAGSDDSEVETDDGLVSRMKEYLEITNNDRGSYLNVDVFKNGHHHSNKSDEVIEMIKPIYTVMQANESGEWPRYMPRTTYTQALLKYGGNIYITNKSQNKNVMFKTNGRDDFVITSSHQIEPHIKDYVSGQYKRKNVEREVKKGNTTCFYSIIVPVDAEIESPTWDISNDNVEIVDVFEGGRICRVKGIKVGTTDITFKAKLNNKVYEASAKAVVK